MQFIPVFFTKLSTEKVNKITLKSTPLFITWLKSVSYPVFILLSARISSGLPPVRSVKQSGYSNFALR
ncbi:hypothetical protein PRCB_21315 [Pantoea rodasii]|uniref:Uncharacterized protein n=1 Tax=Pantoea rodasii TaxID=1076549 RepID=A0A2M9W8C7_9GAMM|nr:hypothetical protein PRCB_21315 [Pantoea rodasii]